MFVRCLIKLTYENQSVGGGGRRGVGLGADYMDRASPVNRTEKCHENLPWAAK